MGLRVNNNITALIAHRNLQIVDFQLQRSIERLSSGLRINRAADDPANYITSEQMRTQIEGIGQAITNTVDSISMIQTVEGAFDEIESLLRSMRTLTLHAANTGPNDTESIANDQIQIQNAIESLSQIATTRKYGSKVLLDGGLGKTAAMGASTATLSTRFNLAYSFMRTDADSTTTADFRTTGNSGTILGTVQLRVATSQDLARLAVIQERATFGKANGNVAALNVDETLTVNGVQIKLTSGMNIIQVKEAINAVAAQTGASALIVRTAANSSASVATLSLNTTATGGLLAANLSLRLYSRNLGSAYKITVTSDKDNSAGNTTGFGGAATVFQTGQNARGFLWIRYGKSSAGVLASATLRVPLVGVGNVLKAMDQDFMLNIFKKGNVKVNFKGLSINMAGPAANVFRGSQNSLTVTASAASINTNISVSSLSFNITLNEAPIFFQIGPNKGEGVEQTVNNMKPSTLGQSGVLSNVDVRSAAGAQSALTVIEEALNQVLKERGRIGSFQKQFLESTKANLAVYKENYQAAESNIRDTDVAAEMITFTRTQILMQSGTAMLAQANLAPQSVLQLLR